MKYIKFIVIALTSMNLYGATLNKFCKDVPLWPKGQDVRKVPGLGAYSVSSVGTPVDAKFGIEKLKASGWLVIDARDKATRETTGRVIGALQIVSDYKVKKDNEFTTKKLLKSLSSRRSLKHFKKRSMKPVQISEDLKAIKYVLFCNGFKCHRSSFAACQLRKMGVPFENIHLLLGGFDELKSAGAKTR